MMEMLATKEAVLQQLRFVMDPELGVNIVDLGLIYEVELTEEEIRIRMTLTTPGCPLHDTIVGGARRALEGGRGSRQVAIDLVWEPRWTPGLMSEAAKEQLSF
jgi:metal-sulfur cluster biosynthetic enzyme